jgi:hypothetical protein
MGAPGDAAEAVEQLQAGSVGPREPDDDDLEGLSPHQAERHRERVGHGHVEAAVTEVPAHDVPQACFALEDQDGHGLLRRVRVLRHATQRIGARRGPPSRREDLDFARNDGVVRRKFRLYGLHDRRTRVSFS